MVEQRGVEFIWIDMLDVDRYILYLNLTDNRGKNPEIQSLICMFLYVLYSFDFVWL